VTGSAPPAQQRCPAVVGGQ